MTDDRDPVVAEALARIAVPDYGPDFWDRLDARLADEGAAGRTAIAPAPGLDGIEGVGVAPAPEPVDLRPDVVVPMARRRGLAERRRAVYLVAAAAAVVVAVLAVSLRSRDDDVRTASGGPGRSSTSVPVAGSPLGKVGLGTSTGSVSADSLADPSTPQGAFVAWVNAVRTHDQADALARTGPRTITYDAALGIQAADQLDGWESAYGEWTKPEGRRIDVVELGGVGDQRVVGLVLRRTAAGTYGEAYGAIPMVLTDGGWKAEPAAFDPAVDGRLEVLSPSPGEHGLTDVSSDALIRVAATGTGEYVLSLDLATATHVPVTDAKDGAVSWDPPDSALGRGGHLLLIAHVSDTTITLEADPFTVL